MERQPSVTRNNPVCMVAGKVELVCPNCYKRHLRDPKAVLKDRKIFRCVNGCTTRLVIRRRYDALPVEEVA